jgi:DNA polymerase
MRTLPIYPQLPYLAVESDFPAAAPLDPNCKLCDLHDKVRTVCMGAEGTPGGLLVVGEGPAAEDDRKGVPYVGTYGVWVRKEIAKHWNGPVVFDNAVRCFPGARDVKDKMIAACRPYLAETMLEARPTRVLAFGTDALKSIVGRSFHSFSSRRGYAYMPTTNVPVFFLIPPPIALRNRYVRSWLEEDVRWALTADPAPPPVGGSVSYVTTPEEAEEVCFDLSTGADIRLERGDLGWLRPAELGAHPAVRAAVADAMPRVVPASRA